ncbi:MAG: hypothetical protein C0391_03460 [Anaerolinea sp.]|nr:hypothetical protein [Anaerolinea sp.]
MNHPFDQIESVLKILLEKKLFFWLPAPLKTEGLLEQISKTLQTALTVNALESPHYLVIAVSNTDYQVWQENQADLHALSGLILHKKQTAGVDGYQPGGFHVIIDPRLTPGEIRIEYANEDCEGTTKHLNLDASSLNIQEAEVNSPYLIDPNERVVSITTSIFNLGRRDDNDMIIQDARVSRQHAQIRSTPNGCMLFDLGSTGGTYVNELRITQHQLHQGDVISLAGYLLIYGDDGQVDLSARNEMKDLSETNPPSDNPGTPLEFIG